MNNNILSNVIKSRRLNLNISQRELASRMNCDVKTISEIEKGIRKKPKIETLEKLSRELYIEIDDLLDYAGYSDYELERYYESDDEIKMVPFNYILMIVGKALVEESDSNVIEKEATKYITELLIKSTGYDDEWDSLLENCDDSFVLININKEK